MISIYHKCLIRHDVVWPVRLNGMKFWEDGGREEDPEYKILTVFIHFWDVIINKESFEYSALNLTCTDVINANHLPTSSLK